MFEEYKNPNAIPRFIQTEEFNTVISKLTPKIYSDLLTKIHEYKEKRDYAVEVKLSSCLSRNLKDTLVYESIHYYEMKTFDGSNKPLFRAIKLSDMGIMDFDEIDLLCRLSMRPSNAAEFIRTMRTCVNFYLPDGFKEGVFNFGILYSSTQNYIEESRKYYTLMSFDPDRRYMDFTVLPPVDEKNTGLVECFREGIPKTWADNIFQLLPKPKEKKWIKYLDFLAAVSKVCFEEYKIYSTHVKRFLTMFDDKPPRTYGVAAGKLRSISDYATDEDPLDGNPIVMSLSDLEDIMDFEVGAALQALSGPGVPTMATSCFGAQQTDIKMLGCVTMVLHGTCSKGSACMFSHDTPELQAKAKEIHKQLSASPYSQGLNVT